jgi:hypothetical protein
MGKPANYNGKKIFIVVVLSLIPGLSLLYLGRWKKSIALFVVDAGILVTFVLTDSYLAKLLAANVYIFTFFAPFCESYQLARYGRNTMDSDSRWYVTVLLLTTGFGALPLLWKSKDFTRGAKIAWSVSVPLLAVIFIFFLISHWNAGETMLRKAFS